MGKRIKRVTIRRQRSWFEFHRRSLKPGCVYEPFWRTDDIPSFGVKEKLPYFNDVKRLVHLLSQNEVWMYLQLAWHPLVIDIYEQYAIPLAYSTALARRIGVEHPIYVGTKTPIVQTIDFVVDLFNPETGEAYQQAIAVKNDDKNELRLRTQDNGCKLGKLVVMCWFYRSFRYLYLCLCKGCR